MADRTLGALREIADRVWVARHAWYDVNVTLIDGAAGTIVVDTLASEQAADELVRRIRGRNREVAAVINTHDHHDHVLGNAALLDAWPTAQSVAHEAAAERIATHLPHQMRAGVADGYPYAAEIAASRVRVPTTTFSGAHLIDLGDRIVELLHPGPGHTAGDVVVRVPDADTVIAGDLLEAADDPNAAVPAYGDDAYPLHWPRAVELVIGLLRPTTAVVPGHGSAVDLDFALTQHAGLTAVAAEIEGLAAHGVAPSDALARGTWPYPPERLDAAVRRGYATLPPGARRLPLA